MLAKNARSPRFFRLPALSLNAFAGKPAPTEGMCIQRIFVGASLLAKNARSPRFFRLPTLMVRPLSGLQALGEEMGRRLAPFLAKAKG